MSLVSFGSDLDDSSDTSDLELLQPKRVKEQTATGKSRDRNPGLGGPNGAATRARREYPLTNMAAGTTGA